MRHYFMIYDILVYNPCITNYWLKDLISRVYGLKNLRERKISGIKSVL